jgi:quinol monooxygenase YgiN
MSVTFIRILSRPNTDVEFRLGSEKLNQHVKETYIDTGKCLQWRAMEYLDDDKLEIMLTSLWRDQESVDELLNDPVFEEDVFETMVYNFENEIITKLADLDGKSLINL